ncbi:MAG TPA: SigB/SigF/SigG family RNA polymerase sigma factor [Acidimicrobiia bacterium]|nr:SigB/SigF/SigG family RNA polymerase sigma factor [Acidimicrobiia bacterium]
MSKTDVIAATRQPARNSRPPTRPVSRPGRRASEEHAPSEALFVQYRRTGNERIRTLLVERHLDLAYALARRYRHRGEAIEDLVQVAALGLVKAVDRFDPEVGASFTSFATPTILGELKRHFRDHGWSVRVPRHLQEMARSVKRTMEEMTHELGHPPSRSDVARRLATSEREVTAALRASTAYQSRSIDAGSGDAGSDDDSLSMADALGSEDPEFDRAETRLTVERLADRLPEPERSVVRLRFFHDMVQVQIADELGMSQMRVSRLLAKSMDRMRSLDAAMQR